ncbi:hypothetical protein ACIOKD_35145 [Streptomyces sp. NPDC087844]|uniref:hypothetical protein n=1 Tax=Streptomyces sp. NPDC087844 TaxID=3365805 RepID=UPI003806ABB4
MAAYASYGHQREFALRGGADEVSASLWPLSVESLAHRPAVQTDAEHRLGEGAEADGVGDRAGRRPLIGTM